MKPTRTLIPLLLLALAACGPSKRAPHTTPKSSRTEISAEQIAAVHAVTVYDAVEKLRPNWLRRRGEQSISAPGAGVVVYLNDTRYGDVATLRSIQAEMASIIRYYDAPSAQYRFGTGNTYGVIQVVMTVGR